MTSAESSLFIGPPALWPPAEPSKLSIEELRVSLLDFPLASLMAHAHDDHAGCLTWTGSQAENCPQIRVGRRLWSARRVVWELVHGPIKPKHQIGVNCADPLCIHPDHLESRTRTKIQKGKKMTQATKTRISITKRAASSLTMEKVREIRASDLTNGEVDCLIGMSAGYASRIRLGRAWADSASPWAGLGAR